MSNSKDEKMLAAANVISGSLEFTINEKGKAVIGVKEGADDIIAPFCESNGTDTKGFSASIKSVTHATPSIAKAVGDLAIQEFSKNPELQVIEANIPLVNDSKEVIIKHVIHREKVYTNNFAKEGEDPNITKHCAMQVNVELSGVKSSASNMKNVFSMLNKQAEEAYGKKD